MSPLSTNTNWHNTGVSTAFSGTFWQFSLCRFFVGFAFDNCFTMMYILGKWIDVAIGQYTKHANWFNQQVSRFYCSPLARHKIFRTKTAAQGPWTRRRFWSLVWVPWSVATRKWSMRNPGKCLHFVLTTQLSSESVTFELYTCNGLDIHHTLLLLNSNTDLMEFHIK